MAAAFAARGSVSVSVVVLIFAWDFPLRGLVVLILALNLPLIGLVVLIFVWNVPP